MDKPQTNISSMLNSIFGNFISKVTKEPKKLFIIVGLAVLIIVILLAIGKDSPSDVVEKLINYSQDSEWEKGKELIAEETRERYKANGVSEYIRLGMEDLVNFNGGLLDEYEITDKSITSDEGLITVNLRYDDGSDIIMEFNMVKENGKWKVLTFSQR
ncbi:DUF4878 domain-containing protein [Niallia sp. MER TA 168]|uniref:DUF4878 domain-containing protein n=1 Tax=Niallia sp. MER TA 168 TaxID=2939568 RepID=UPI00203BF432|nr:DUF4878 domain-containing protein [Niallia sp. MER TA 168]MCM3364310.1 DUF4878 domain-containing protein [Niallia sp. MER TA 168]